MLNLLEEIFLGFTCRLTFFKYLNFPRLFSGEGNKLIHFFKRVNLKVIISLG